VCRSGLKLGVGEKKRVRYWATTRSKQDLLLAGENAPAQGRPTHKQHHLTKLKPHSNSAAAQQQQQHSNSNNTAPMIFCCFAFVVMCGIIAIYCYS
jgi:hypothetical protein